MYHLKKTITNSDEHIPISEMSPMPEEMNKNYNKLALISAKEILTEYLKIENETFNFNEIKLNLINMMRKDLFEFENWFVEIFIKIVAKLKLFCESLILNKEFIDKDEIRFFYNGQHQQDVRDRLKEQKKPKKFTLIYKFYVTINS